VRRRDRREQHAAGDHENKGSFVDDSGAVFVAGGAALGAGGDAVAFGPGAPIAGAGRTREDATSGGGAAEEADAAAPEREQGEQNAGPAKRPLDRSRVRAPPVRRRRRVARQIHRRTGPSTTKLGIARA
jgi:hypothetical protein